MLRAYSLASLTAVAIALLLSSPAFAQEARPDGSDDFQIEYEVEEIEVDTSDETVASEVTTRGRKSKRSSTSSDSGSENSSESGAEGSGSAANKANKAKKSAAAGGNDDITEADIEASLSPQMRRKMAFEAARLKPQAADDNDNDALDDTDGLSPRMRRKIAFEAARVQPSNDNDAPAAGGASASTGRARAQRVLTRPNGDGDGAPVADGGLPAPPRRRVFRSRANETVTTPPAVGSEFLTNNGRYNVKKKFGGGAIGGVYLLEATEPVAERGRLSVLKHAEPLDNTPDTGADYFDIDQMSVKRKERLSEIASRPALKKGKEYTDNAADYPDLTPEQLRTSQTRHEVEMQNVMAARNPQDLRFRPASQVASNRIKMPYMGVTSESVVKELNDSLAAGTLDPRVYRAAMQKLTRQTLEVTAEMGDAGIVHRDLKMDNLAIGPDGRMGVLDFGLAKRAGDSDYNLMLRTGVGMQGMGNPDFAAPEADEFKSNGEKNVMSTHKSDVYYAAKAFKRQALVEPPDAAQFGASTSPLRAHTEKATKGTKLQKLLDKMTAEDPKKRPTARQALKNKSNWEKFSGPTTRDADQAIANIARRLNTAQTGAVVAPPAPAGAASTSSAATGPN